MLSLTQFNRILWRKITYEWLNFEAYQSYQTFTVVLKDILDTSFFQYLIKSRLLEFQDIVKIVYISKALIPSRTANSLHIMKMCQAFANNGHEVELLVLSEKESEERNMGDIYRYYSVKSNFKVTWVPMIATNGSRLRYLMSSLVLGYSLIRRLIFIRCDIVYGRDLLGCTLSALLGKRTIFESHAPIWRSQLESALFKGLLRLPRFSRLVVISDALRQVYLSRYTLLNASNTMIAHDASDLPEEMTDVSLLQGNPKRLQVGYVGHLYKGKGVEVVDAIAPLIPDVNFHIIGGLEHDIEYWKSKITSPNVFFYGFIKQGELSQYIYNLDICLLPNQHYISGFGKDSEKSKNISKFTSPLKMFEYMAHKKPIIASDLPVLREVLSSNIACLVPPMDFEAWQNAISRLRSSKNRDFLANKAHAVFLENYTWGQRAKLVIEGIN